MATIRKRLLLEKKKNASAAAGTGSARKKEGGVATHAKTHIYRDPRNLAYWEGKDPYIFVLVKKTGPVGEKNISPTTTRIFFAKNREEKGTFPEENDFRVRGKGGSVFTGEGGS